jgi:hypothetical protein
MMTPQLFINYKLKSVAHLPWRMLTYKALNTFIDDIFAFVIKMPTLYRIGCLRDGRLMLNLCFRVNIHIILPKKKRKKNVRSIKNNLPHKLSFSVDLIIFQRNESRLTKNSNQLMALWQQNLKSQIKMIYTVKCHNSSMTLQKPSEMKSSFTIRLFEIGIHYW